MSTTPPAEQEPHTLRLGLTINTFSGTPTTPNALHSTGGNIDLVPRFSFTTKSKTAVQMTEDSVTPSAQPIVIHLGGEGDRRDSVCTEGSEEDIPKTTTDHLSTSTIVSLNQLGQIHRRPTAGAGSPIPTETIISAGSPGGSGNPSPNRGSPISSHSPVRAPVEPPSPPSLDKDDSSLCTKFFKAVCECCCGSKKGRR